MAIFQAHALTNNLVLTPPMGWNDWNSYKCNITEADVTNTATVIASNGMAKAGYQFVNIDDGWAGSRDSNGVIVADPTAFPHGIKWLADFVHSKGLKLGVYTDHGTNTCSTCANNNTTKSPGSFGHEYIDAMTYAQWGVDYLKDDSCNQAIGSIAYDDYFRMSDGLLNSGRQIVFSLCENHEHYEYWSADLGNLWRTTGDIGNTYSSMIGKVDQNSKSAYVAGPGRWNDSDMLEIGNNEFATNFVAAQTHFSLWCIMAAPLLAGNDVTTMSAQSLQILTNAEAIAVDQDSAGEQGIRVDGTAGFGEVWSKPLGYDFTTRAVALVNRSTTTATNITCTWTNLGLQAGSATVRDLWAHKDLGTFTDGFTTNVPPKGSVFLKIVGTPLAPPSLGTNYLSDLQPVYAYTGWPSWLSVSNDTSIGGNTITLDGVTYTKGIGTHAIGGQEYNLGGICSRFQSDIGVDDEVGSNGSVVFQVFADGRKIYDSGIMTGASATQSIDLDVTGVRRLTIGVTDTGNDNSSNRNSNDHADWAGAHVVVTNTTPRMPGIPAGLTASPASAITLTWNPALAGISYNVKRATISGGPYVTITNVYATAFSDTNVSVGTTYYYVVSAVSSFGEGSNSLQAASSPCLIPSAPTNFTKASVTTSNIVLKWNASSGALSYNIYRFTGTTPLTLVGSGITATNFTDTPISAAATNYYVIVAANSCNQSGYSDVAAVVTPPGAPTGLNATAGNSQITLNWTAPPGGVAFNVKRATVNGGPYTIIASNISSTGYLDLTVVNGTTYYYVVSAIDDGGEGPNSSQAGVTPFSPVTAYWTNTVTATPQNWNINGNWTNAPAFPNSSSVLTIINANISAPQTINLNQSITVGSLQIGDADNSAGYTIAANGGSLTFSDTNSVSLTQVSTSKGDVLATPITVATNLVVINNSTNPLTFAGNVSSSGGATLTVGSGTLQIGDGTTNGSLGSVSVADNASLIFNGSDDVTMSGTISGSGSVAQNGTGVLTLSGANSFSGGVMIQNGTLLAGSPSALGSTSAATVITNGGTLDVNAQNLTGESVTVSGAGAGSQGAIVNSSGQQTSALRKVTLAGDTTIGGTGPWNPTANINRWDIRAASTSSTNGCSLSTGGHPYKLTKVGSNQISLVAVCVDTNLGDIDIQEGLVGWEKATSSMGNPASNIIVRAGATLSFFQTTTAWNKHFILYGNGVSTNMYNWSGANVIIGPMQLNGDCVFWGGGTSLALYNVISGTGSLIENGTYNLYLAATNDYSGNTVINGGVLILTNNGSIFNSANIIVNSGATLDATQRGDATLTLANSQTLSGSGTLNGNVVIGGGATLAPANSFTVLNFNNNLTLGGGSATVMELNETLATNDVVQVAGTLTYGGTLVLTNLSGTLINGDSFKLFNAAACSGAFTNISPAIPGINLAWNTNNLSSGILSIVVSPTTSPKITAMNLNGGNFIFAGSNGIPNWPYVVLASTNVALPLTNWTPVWSNTFDANGYFNFTNPENSGGQFYLLELR